MSAQPKRRALATSLSEVPTYWWLVVLSIACWVAMISAWRLDGLAARFPSLDAICGRLALPMAPTARWAAWLPMVLTMVLPLTIVGARQVTERSLRSRRQRSVGAYELGYLAIWAAFTGLMACAYEVSSRLAVSSALAVPLLLVSAAIWSLTRYYSLARMTCHDVRPLAPKGSRADLTAIRYGAHHGLACVATCGLPTMGAMLQVEPMLLMLVVANVSYLERYRFKPNSRWPAVGYLGCAMLTAAGK